MGHYELTMRKFVIGFLVLAILGVGVFVGLLLVQQQQIFKQKAAVPTGTATVSIQPAQASFQRNTPNTISIYFNTAGTLVSGVSVRLTFSNLGVTASSIQISPDLLSSGNWSCPIKSISSQGSTGQVDISCINTAEAGYSTQTDTFLASFSLTATQVPVVNPLIVGFDTQQSIITKKSDGSDILLTPQSTGSYTITDIIAQSPTASPLLVFTSPTATPLGGLLPTITPTPTATASSTPTFFTATTSATVPPIPVTGFDTPTIIGAAAGALLLLISTLVIIL